MTTTRDEYIADAAARLIAARIITYSGAVDEACCLAGRLEECGVAPWQDDETVGIEAVELCRQAVKAECAAKEAALRDLADLRAKLAAAEKERDDLAAMLKGAEYRRDKWEAGYNALRAEVDAVRQALIGLTIPRPDATAEIAALRESLSLSEKAHLDTKKERNQFREALRVERAACDRAAGLIDDDESESRRQWRREYDARRAAAKAKPKRAVAFGHGASWFVSIGTLGTPAFPSKESAAAFAAAINGEDAT